MGFKVGDRVRINSKHYDDEKHNMTGVIDEVCPLTATLYLDEAAGWGRDARQWSVHVTEIELIDNLPQAPTSFEGDEFTVMRVCAAWIDGLPTDLEKFRVLTYLEDRFEA